jgi:hypothetical protein
VLSVAGRRLSDDRGEQNVLRGTWRGVGVDSAWARDLRIGWRG